MIQVCVRRRPGANADVMSCWEGKLHATSKDSACKRLLSISSKILILFHQIKRGNCLLAQYSNVSDHGRCIALYQILEIGDGIT